MKIYYNLNDREFLASVKTKKGEHYSKSSINLHASLNQFLCLPPDNRIINLKHNDIPECKSSFHGQLKKTKNYRKYTCTPLSDIFKMIWKNFMTNISLQDWQLETQKNWCTVSFLTWCTLLADDPKKNWEHWPKISFDYKKTTKGT